MYSECCAWACPSGLMPQRACRRSSFSFVASMGYLVEGPTVGAKCFEGFILSRVRTKQESSCIK
jgi:hypothetical protein